MKRLFLLSLMAFLSVSLMSQSVQRDYVVLEIGTGTWCMWCPGAARGADDLVANGQKVAVIENHNGDVYANTYSNTRNSYNNVSGYPSDIWDGNNQASGGAQCPSGNKYSDYLPLYNAAYAILSPLKIDISGTSSGNDYDITLSIMKVNTIPATDLKVHLVLTESHILDTWPSAGCMSEVNFVNRLMVPDENGTSLSFASGDFQVLNLSFTKDPSWDASHCELVAFVQSQGAKTIYNAMKVDLTALPTPMSVDFTGSPTSGCAPVVTSYTGTASGATNWSWTFENGSPATATSQNPSVTYTATGTNDVTLTAWNASTGRGNSITKSNYVNISAVPIAPGMPQGVAGMCINPPNQTYTTSGASGSSSYTWELDPPAAGVLSPSGTSCTIDFTDTWTGTAELFVRGSNSCGDGAWSEPLQITVSEEPTTPGTPSGPDQLCMNAPDTDYTTSGGTPATSYTWELLPYEAGALYPNGNSCMVDWVDAYAGDATLRVKALNGSCESAWSAYLNITINPGPTAFNVAGGGPYCGQGGTGSEVTLDGSETGVDYTLYLDGTATSTVVSGTGSPISFGEQMEAGAYTAMGANAQAGCDNSMEGEAVVTIDPEPPYIPGEPDGPDMVYTGATPTSDYVTSGGQYATSYSWDLSPTEAGTIDGSGTTGTVTWDPTYSGPAAIKVQGVNSCGGGSFSTSFEITVDVGVGLPETTTASGIKIYPNPAKDRITLVAQSQGPATVMLYDAYGNLKINQAFTTLEAPQQLDVSTLASGIYFIRIRVDGTETGLKLIIE